MRKFNDRTGEIGINNQGLKMWIKEYRGCKDIDVEFENGFVVTNNIYQNFKNRAIKNPYHLSVYGVGFVGDGGYKTTVNDKHTVQYQTWQDMLRRCRDEKYQQKFPTYKGCEVCEDWHNFQNFAKWYDENYYTVDDEQIHIDKDILFKGNKIYSPETCIFVPNRINSLFIKCNNVRGKYPIGVSWNKRVKKFVPDIRINSYHKYLGLYNTPEEAFEIYKTEKEKYIKEVADEYKDKINQRLYDAMYRYIIEITD